MDEESERESLLLTVVKYALIALITLFLISSIVFLFIAEYESSLSVFDYLLMILFFSEGLYSVVQKNIRYVVFFGAVMCFVFVRVTTVPYTALTQYQRLPTTAITLIVITLSFIYAGLLRNIAIAKQYPHFDTSSIGPGPVRNTIIPQASSGNSSRFEPNSRQQQYSRSEAVSNF